MKNRITGALAAFFLAITFGLGAAAVPAVAAPVSTPAAAVQVQAAPAQVSVQQASPGVPKAGGFRVSPKKVFLYACYTEYRWYLGSTGWQYTRGNNCARQPSFWEQHTLGIVPGSRAWYPYPVKIVA